MNEAKEFLGKNLDAAIAEACKYYDSSRDQLEIEIIEDAKSGIFGLVGARKAKIMARRVEIPDLLRQGKSEKPRKESKAEAKPEAKIEPKPKQSPKTEALADAQPRERQEKSAPREDRQAADSASKNQQNRGRKNESEADGKPASAQAQPQSPSPSPSPSSKAQKGQGENPEKGAAQPAVRADEQKKNSRTAGNRGKKPAAQAGQPGRQEVASVSGSVSEDGQDNDMQDNGFPKVSLADLDQAKLERTCREIIMRLAQPITEELEVKVNIGNDRVQLRLESEDSGLLIGREGQNLAAIQYLATRMISRAMEAQIKIQVDAGDYHTRQDVRLQEMAQTLAQKVRTSGRSMSTKPLSAYQRRIIHLALQEDPDVQTRSSGEGALKRVVVMRRKTVE